MLRSIFKSVRIICVLKRDMGWDQLTQGWLQSDVNVGVCAHRKFFKLPLRIYDFHVRILVSFARFLHSLWISHANANDSMDAI